MASRALHPLPNSYESSATPGPESSPDPIDLELGTLGGDQTSRPNSPSSPADSGHDHALLLDDQGTLYPSSRHPSRWTLSSLWALLFTRRRGHQYHRHGGNGEPPKNSDRGQSIRRRILKVVAIFLMLLGLLQCFILIYGIILALFPDELDWVVDPWRGSSTFQNRLGHWPTDATADINPVACHSHNDYWRKEPLFSAIKAGCTGVEADVWLIKDELFVGHSESSLTETRTFRSLYINPILEILDKQNPTTPFHVELDIPRNGIFDTNPAQTLVLLIDFKTDGDELWSHVHSQLEPLRQKQYLSYFNGTSVVPGPITAVVTGNAPFTRVVANTQRRDMFFDAPLGLMALINTTQAGVETKYASTPTPIQALNGTTDSRGADSTSRDANQGQGYSGAAPQDPSLYTAANSYYVSASFKQTIGFPWRLHLTSEQLTLMRQQIAGAHKQGLKVRYWDIPAWPRSLRNYLWRVLVREGVDYLNVDDLKAATTGDWGRGSRAGWWSAWNIWS